MKRTNKLLSVLLTLCMIVGMIPWAAMPARAASVGTSWVGNITVTEDNDTVGSVTLTGDTTLTIPAGKTLTVNGEISMQPDIPPEEPPEEPPDIPPEEPPDIPPENMPEASTSLTVEGGGTLVVSTESAYAAVNVDNLTLNCKTITVKNKYGYGVIFTSSMTVESGTVTVEGDGYKCFAICSEEVSSLLTVNGGTVTANFTSDTDGVSICCDTIVNGGTVTAHCAAGESCGYFGNLTLAGGSFTADSYYNDENTTVTVAEGKLYTDGTTTYRAGQISNLSGLGGKTLAPGSCAARIGNDDYYTVQEAIDAATSGQTVRLLRDVTTASAITVGVNRTVTLDLAGHTIDRGLTEATEATENGNVITVSGNLTLKDSSENKTGKITGGNTSDYGGGVYVVDGTFTMSGGTITGNKSDAAENGGCGGGVCVAGGRFVMSGGSIKGNCAFRDGGGVYVSNGTFTMSDGEISDNETVYNACGGGVYVGGGSFVMSGGSIKGNRASSFGSGVYVANMGTFEVSGTPVVKDNTLDNVCLTSDRLITVTGALGEGAFIGVARGEGEGYDGGEVAQGGGNPAHTLTTADVSHFFSDNVEGYGPFVVMLNGSGKAELVTATEVYDWDMLYDALQNDGYVRLCADAEYGTGDGENESTALTVPSNKAVILDLAGHTIDRGLTGKTASDNGYVIKINGNLTLIDSSDKLNTPAYDGTGKITGGNNSSSSGSGGVYVSGGTFTMNGGTITGNTAKNGGGVCLSEGTFTMSRGTISGNNTTGNGGGVCLNGTFTMNGGTITGNAATGNGGGVYVNGTFNISGDATVTGNTANGAASNVYLESDKAITVTGALTEEASIGVTMKNPSVFTVGWNTYMSDKTPSAYFTSDNDAYGVGLNAQGEAVLAIPVTVTFAANGGTGSNVTQKLLNGLAAALDANTFTRAGYAFTGWNTEADGTGTAYANGQSVTLTADTTLYAQWKLVPSLTGGKVTAPKGAVLILASYDANGRMTSVQSKTLTEDCVNKFLSELGLTVPSGAYKLMLVDGTTYAPLCAAWDNARRT